MTTINDFLLTGLPAAQRKWIVNTVWQTPNVQVDGGTSAPDSEISFTQGSASQCGCSVTGGYVANPDAVNLPVKWTQATFTFDAGTGELSAGVLSANNSPIPVRFTISNGAITCFVNIKAAPNGTWTGTHP